tara:strand:- start:344 stop:502 length:159 start_codon:yes stop_codon:yes gene_type:complete
LSKRYLGDKYVKAYAHFRTQQEEKISKLILKIRDLENAVEWMMSKLIEGDPK